MKLLPILATTNAFLAAVSALLGAAPFTGALMAFIFWLPLAALFARKHQTVAALSVPVFAAVAWAFAPIRIDHSSIYLFAVWVAWAFVWSLMIVYFSRHKLRAAITAIRGGGSHGI